MGSSTINTGITSSIKRFMSHAVRETRHAATQTYLLGLDLFKMIDVNDFGRYLSKNLSRRFIALSGVVTLFSVIGEYTKRIVYGEELDAGLAENLIDTLLANFLFFGIPGGILLLMTQVFSFFNRSNYFTAQANYINLLELYKRTPRQLEDIIDKLWRYVYQAETAIFSWGRSHHDMCDQVSAIQQRKTIERARILRENVEPNTGPRNAAQEEVSVQPEGLSEAKIKFQSYQKRIRAEGYLRFKPWDEMSIRQRCQAVDHIIDEETAEEITHERLCYCRQGFKFNAHWALHSPLQLNLKFRKSGIDLKLVEDWLDGAFFDVTDTKLIEQFIAEATIKSAKVQARIPPFPMIVIQAMRTMRQRVWTFMVFGITAKRIGRYLNHLNLRYVKEESAVFDRDYFKAEAFFWPSEAYEAEIEQEIGKEALLKLRRLRERWLSLTLGGVKMPRLTRRSDRAGVEEQLTQNTEKTIQCATRVIGRMFDGSIYNMHELRLSYDPNYVIQMSNRSDADFNRMGIGLNYIERHRRRIKRKRDNVLTFLNYLDILLDPITLRSHNIELYADKEARRAIRVAYHINERGLKRLVDRERRRGYDHLLRHRIYNIMRDVVRHKESYSRKIRKLKVFETLAIHHIKTYRNNVRDIYREIEKHHKIRLEARLELLKRRKTSRLPFRRVLVRKARRR